LRAGLVCERDPCKERGATQRGRRDQLRSRSHQHRSRGKSSCTDDGRGPQRVAETERGRESRTPVASTRGRVEPFAQQHDAALQPALDRRERHAGRLCDRGRRQVFEETQQQRAVIRLRQREQRRGHALQQLAVFGDARRGVSGCRRRREPFPPLTARRRTAVVAREPAQHLQQPGPDAVAPFRRPTQRRERRVLHEVVRTLLPHEVTRERSQRARLLAELAGQNRVHRVVRHRAANTPRREAGMHGPCDFAAPVARLGARFRMRLLLADRERRRTGW
jgi:hypothetical protein